MIFWIVAGLITALSVALLLRPLSKTGREGAGRGEASFALYRDQLREVDNDLERGVIGAEEAAAARREIERRMLRADSDRQSEAAAAQGSEKRNMIAALVLAALFPVAGAGLYLYFGSPDQPGLPYAEREEERAIIGQANSQIDQLRGSAEDDPQNPEAWIGLAQGLATIQRYGEAAAAFRQAIALSGDESLRAAYGEMLTLAAGGSVTPEARQAFEAALAYDARDPRARYYLGLALSQEGRLQDAIDAWMALAADSTPDAPWRPVLEQAIRDVAAELGQDPGSLDIPGSSGVAAGPTQEQMDAAGEMNAEDRDAMIRSMVERLAARLAEDPENPENFDDWLRLAQSYAVLGESQKAAEALQVIEKIVEKLPEDDPRRQAFEEGMRRGGGQ